MHWGSICPYHYYDYACFVWRTLPGGTGTSITGRPIRTDLQTAAHEVRDHACGRVQAVLGDTTDAASMMERTVFEVSRYLDRIGSPLFGKCQRTSHRGFLSLTSATSNEAAPHRTGGGSISTIRAVSHVELCQPALCGLARLPVGCRKSCAASQPARSDAVAASQCGIRLEGNRCHFENDRLRSTSGILARSKASEGKGTQESSPVGNSVVLAFGLPTRPPAGCITPCH